MPSRAAILPHALELRAILATACEPDRCCIAGSVRRERQECHDLEIVALPRWDVNLLGERDQTSAALDATIDLAILSGVVAWDRETPRNGPRYKRLWLPALGMAVDLFLADPDNFGNILAIRTGNAAFSKFLVSGRHMRQYNHAQGYLWRDGRVVPCPTEEAFFEAIGLQWVDPRYRDACKVYELQGGSA